jgi:hypothetical protein
MQVLQLCSAYDERPTGRTHSDGEAWIGDFLSNLCMENGRAWFNF